MSADPAAFGPNDWAPSDIAFATLEIRREFPSVSAAAVAQVIESAAKVTAVAEGRVNLTKAARKILRSQAVG